MAPAVLQPAHGDAPDPAGGVVQRRHPRPSATGLDERLQHGAGGLVVALGDRERAGEARELGTEQHLDRGSPLAHRPHLTMTLVPCPHVGSAPTWAFFRRACRCHLHGRMERQDHRGVPSQPRQGRRSVRGGSAPATPQCRRQIGCEPCAPGDVPEGRRQLRRVRLQGRRPVWTKQKAAYPGFAEYEQRTTRSIPVIILEREK